MPTVTFADRSRVNISNVLSIYAYFDAIRVFTPAVNCEFTISGPYTHTLAAPFLVNLYPQNLVNGPVFPKLYPVNCPVIESIQPQPPKSMKGLGRPFGFSTPCRNRDFIWFLLEGRDFAAFQRQARFCQYKPDDEKGVLYLVFNREVYRITPLVKPGQTKAEALSALLDQLDSHFPPCDVPNGENHINTFSVYAGDTGPFRIPAGNALRNTHERYHVASIEQVDPVANAGEWDGATAAPSQGMTRARVRQEQSPEYPIPGLAERRKRELEQEARRSQAFWDIDR